MKPETLIREESRRYPHARTLRPLTAKLARPALLVLFSNVCLGEVAEFSRETKFASPDQFAEAARNFRPADKPSELSYVFAAPERGNDDSAYGKLVFADGIIEVKELSRTADACAYFVQAEPKTAYTRSAVAGLFLRRDENSTWRITTFERFLATGVGGWIECKVIPHPSPAKDSPPLGFRVTETDAGRRDVLAERVYSLEYGHGIRLKPIQHL